MKKQFKNGTEGLQTFQQGCSFLIRRVFVLIFLTNLLTLNLLASPFDVEKDVRISIKKNDATLSEVISEIEKQTGYSVIVRLNGVDLQKHININVQNQSVSKVLDEHFNDKNIKYEIKGKTISIFKATEKPVSVAQSASSRKITGTIRDTTGEALIGASVSIVEQGKSAITDLDGNFELEASSKDILEISYIGFITQTLKADKLSYNIVLEEDSKQLNEVVVVGFGSQKKVNLTGSVATVSSDAFEGRAVQNATMMLQGLVPGLNITKGVGVMDSAPSINIRGTTTIGQGSTGNPLILIDGMEGDLHMLNPQDIETVSVLKDAAASSIYGSRAPFGVILITTKTGKNGRYAVNYNNSLRWSTPVKRPKMVDSYRFGTYFNDAALNAAGTGHFTAERMQRIRDYMDGKISTKNIVDPKNPDRWGDGYDHANDNVDWWDALYNKWNFSQEHTASITGGNEKLQMYASINALDNNGMIKLAKDTYKRYATNLRVTSQLSKQFHVSYNMKFSRSDYDRPVHMGYTDRLGYQTWPVLPVYDDNGYMFSSPSPALFIRDGGRDKNRRDALSQQARVIVKPIEKLEIVGELNHSFFYNRNHWDVQQIFNHNVAGLKIPTQTDTQVREASSSSDYINPNVYATYNMNIAENHNVKVMGGFQSETGKYDNFDASRKGIVTPGMDVLNGTNGIDGRGDVSPPGVSGKKDKWAVVGFFGRLNYDWKERYLAEFNIRHDGTSRFRSDQRWKTFPSASIGWNIAREDFWSDYDSYVSLFKLRASYGILGNQNTEGYYPTYLKQPMGTANGEWLIGGAKPNTADAPGIVTSSTTWETVRSLNLGLDVAMLSNRLNLNFDWFQRETRDMIGPPPELPAILGTGEPRTNNTDLRTRGWELSLNWRDVINKDLSYSVGANVSDNSTVITNYPNENFSLDTYYTGQKLGEIWGYETIGIAKTKEEMANHIATLPKGGQDQLGSAWSAGDIMYKDLNGDGMIGSGTNTLSNSGDRKIIGNNSPRYRFGITLGGQWKSFDLSMFFQGVMKRDYWESSWNFWGFTESIWRSTAYEEHMDYFRPNADHYLGQNLDAYYPRPFDGSDKNQKAQTKYLQDASYIRLKNLQIGYTLPKTWMAKAGITNLKIYVSGENLWTGTKLKKMFDPEALGFGNGSIGYPLSKTLSFGASVTF